MCITCESRINPGRRLGPFLAILKAGLFTSGGISTLQLACVIRPKKEDVHGNRILSVDEAVGKLAKALHRITAAKISVTLKEAGIMDVSKTTISRRLKEQKVFKNGGKR